MRRLLYLLCLTVCLGCGDTVYHEHAIVVPKDDPAMQAAIAEAKRTLPEFWAVVDKTPEGVSGLAVKIEVTDQGKTEYFWLSPLAHEEGKLMGTVNNHPNAVQSVELGKRIEVPRDKICDWLYVREGKIHGNFTIRPLLARMPREEAEKIRKRLASEAELNP